MKEQIKGFLAGVIFRIIALLTLGQISPILSACVIIEQDGKILLIDRADGLGYTIPGGIVRYRETMEQCIRREVYEETGFHVAIEKLQGVYSSIKRDPRFRAVCITYHGTIIDGALHDSNEGKACWREPGEVFSHMAFDCEEMLKDYLHGRTRFS
jgi:8-oxo-dGTP diphosphatase